MFSVKFAYIKLCNSNIGIKCVKLNCSKLQNKAKISKFWKQINQELNALLVLHSTILKWLIQNMSCTPLFLLTFTPPTTHKSSPILDCHVCTILHPLNCPTKMRHHPRHQHHAVNHPRETCTYTTSFVHHQVAMRNLLHASAMPPFQINVVPPS